MLASFLDDSDEALYQLACMVKQTGYQFTTVTPATHERVNSRPENQRSRSLEDIFGWSRPFQAEVLPLAMFSLMNTANVVSKHAGGWQSLVRFSTLDNQIFLHSAYPTTNADAVFFGPDTYRYVTTIRHHLASHPTKVGRAIDIGCGAGPGAIFTALSCPGMQVWGVDINQSALRFSRINSMLSGVPSLELQYSNLLSDVDGSFDLIIANPPYLIDPGKRSYRHGGGVLGAGLSLAIVEASIDRLERNGTLLLYTGSVIVNCKDHFLAALKERLAGVDVSWSYQEMDPDIFGEELLTEACSHADRIAAVVLTMTKN